MTLRLIHSRPSTSDVLLNDLCTAAHELVWAEDAATWHRNLGDAPDFANARAQSLSRVESILRDAERTQIITGAGVRRLMGVMFDALACARWRVTGPPLPGSDTASPIAALPGFDTASQIAALPRTLRQVWRACRVQAVVGQTLRLAS